MDDFYFTSRQDKIASTTFFEQHGFKHASDALENSKIHYNELPKYVGIKPKEK